MKKLSCLFTSILFLLLLVLGCQNPLENRDVAAVANGHQAQWDFIPLRGDLIAARHIKVGNVTATNDTENLYVKYSLADGWEMTESHLAVATSLEGIPQTRTGNPIPGQFKDKMLHDPATTEYCYTIPLGENGFEGESLLFLAAHAEVQKVDAMGNVLQAEGAWAAGGAGEKFAGKNWATYFTFELESSSIVIVINDELASHNLGMRMIAIIPEGSTDTYRGMTLTAYALSETEVTQGDYLAVVGSNPSSGPGLGESKPVFFVTWYDSVRFCNSLSALCGLQPVYDETTWIADFSYNGFYLPTDAQWEYAAGGPDHYIWSLGNTFIESDYVYHASGIAPVKSKAANGFGLYDTSGNAWEWIHDFWGGAFPYAGQTDPNGPTEGTIRFIRGGSWYSDTTDALQCDFRGPDPATYSDNAGSIRVAVGGHSLWN